MVLVRFGWIHTKFCSFALVAWHRLQQRKLILAKNETHKKQKHNQNTESPKTTRQDSPEKTQQNQKTKATKTILTMIWLFCVFLVCFFLCALVVYFLNRYILYAVRLKSLVYKKDQSQTPYSNFWLERKRRVKHVWKEGGTGPPLLRIHFLNFWVGPMVGYGWIHTPSNQILLYVLVYKQILSYIFFGSKEKKSSKMYEWGGDRLTPPWNTFLG